jgi:hypothetical protein
MYYLVIFSLHVAAGYTKSVVNTCNCQVKMAFFEPRLRVTILANWRKLNSILVSFCYRVKVISAGDKRGYGLTEFMAHSQFG